MKTKKRMIFAILLMSLGTLTAQIEDKRDQLTFCVKAGINISNVWDEKGQDFVADRKIGAVGGVFLSVPIGKYIGIQPEVLFSQKGFKGGGKLLGYSYSFTRTTSYLDVPILFQFKPIQYFTFLIGPQFSYLFKEKNVYTFGTNSTEQAQEFSNEDIRNNILGFIVGADFNISSLVVSARAGWDFQTNNKNGTSTTPRYKNQLLQLTVGFRI